MKPDDHLTGQGLNFFLNVVEGLQNTLNMHGEFEAIIQQFLEQLMGGFLITRGAIMLVEPGEVKLVSKAHSGLTSEIPGIQLDPAAFETMISNPQTVYFVNQPAAELSGFFQQNQAALEALDAHLWVLLKAKNSLLGVVSLSRRFHDSPFSPEDLRILQIVGSNLATAVYNQILFSEMRSQNETAAPKITPPAEQPGIDTVIRLLSRVSADEDLTNQIMDAALELCQCDQGALFITQPHNPLLKLHASVGFDPTQASATSLSKNSRWLISCFEKRQAVSMNSIEDRRLRKIFPCESALAAPMSVGDNSVGVLILGDSSNNGTPRHFEPAEAQLLSFFAHQASLIYENQKVSNKLREHRARAQLLMDSMMSGLFMVNMFGQVLAVNSAIAEMIGLTSEQIVGREYQAVFEADPHIVDLIQQAILSGKPVTEHAIVCRTIAPDCEINLSASAMLGNSGVPEGATVSIERLPVHDKVRQLFHDRVAPATYEMLMGDSTGPDLGGETRDATVLVYRITNIADVLAVSPESAVMDRLSEFFDRARRIIFAHGGALFKVNATEIAAVFGVPVLDDGASLAAMRSAVDFLDTSRLEQSNQNDSDAVYPEVALGVSCGKIVGGRINSINGGRFAAIGEPLHTAEHLAAIAKPGQVMVSHAIAHATDSEFEFEKQKKTRVKDWPARVQTYRLCDEGSASVNPSTELDENA